MSQLSVYLRPLVGKEQAEAMTRKVEKAIPVAGNVQILYFTDKQYEQIVCFRGRKKNHKTNPPQLMLF